MMRRITRTTSAAVVLLSTHMSTVPANAAPVNRPLADELTRRFNQQELEQLQSGAGTYSESGADQLNRQQLGQPEAAPPPGSARPEWSYLPR